MPTEQKDRRTRRRSKKIGSIKYEQFEEKSVKKSAIPGGPVVTWLKKEWPIILGLFFIFILSLFLRSYFYYPIATEDGFLLSGNDPFYHKRVIDHAQEYFTHLRDDPLLDYPLVGVNPRPPVYDWSNAVSGMFLAPFLNGDIASTTWYVFLFSPAFWGALTIFPVYFITRDIFGRKPAIISAFFMCIMASHIERSPLGFSDHDAMVVFFVVTSMLFLAKAFGHLDQKYWVKKWRNPADISSGIRDFFADNIESVGFSILCGLSIGTIALIWKGFAYVLVILLVSFLIISLINLIRKYDSMGIFICIYIAFAVGLGVSMPYYSFFNIGTWIQPLYLMMAFIIIGIAFVPTRDLPWLVVVPTFIITLAVISSILMAVQPETMDALFTGGGYFIKSKLYGTIAEAQAPDTSRLAISYGPVTFYLALIGLVLAAIQIPKHWKLDFFLIIVWCGLAIYMSMSAVRFMFNATPVFAILSGWITWNIVERLDPTLRVFRKPEIRFSYLYIGIAAMLIMSLTYWLLYLEYNNYIYYQIISGLGLFGIFLAMFVAWLMLKYNFWIGIFIYVAFIVFWIWYTFDILFNQVFDDQKFVWDTFPFEQFGVAIGVLAIVFIPIILLFGVYILYRRTLAGLKLDLQHISIALFFAFLVFTPNLMFAIDASIPYEAKTDFDPSGKTFGAFGHSFPSEYWQEGMYWLAEQDNQFIIEERPAFISWWDYGFWCLYLGDHPTVADNFQAGYQLAGSFIASTNETQAISLFATRILEGNFRDQPRWEFSEGVKDIIIKHFDNNNQKSHPNYDKIFDILYLEHEEEDKQNELIKEVKSKPGKYGKFSELLFRNAKYAAVRHIIESFGKEHVVDFLHDLEMETDNSIRYFAVDTRLFPFTASNTGIFYAPIRLADKDIADYIKYYALVEVRDNVEADWRAYSDQPIPTEEIEDEVDLLDLVDSHGGNNVRIKEYQIKYTDEFYNCMFYKCYIGYSYNDLYPDRTPSDELQSVPGIYGSLEASEPMQGWNMTHFRLVYRTAYWTPHNQTELASLPDKDKAWRAMSELEAIKTITDLERDGVDNDNNGQVDDRGEGGTWSPAYRGGGVFFLKYYDGAVIHGKVVTDSIEQIPLQGIRVTVLDDFGIPHDTVFTDENGNYSIIVPFGNAILATSKDGYPEDDQESLEMRQRLTEQTTLNTSVHEITDAQAMRRTSNWMIKSDLKVPVGSVKGKLYWDLDNEGTFNPTNDEVINNGKIMLNGTIKKYGLQYSTEEFNEENNYEFTNVVPGEYKLSAELNGHIIEFPESIVVSSETMDINQDFGISPSTIWGNATFVNDTTLVPNNVRIKLLDLTNDTILTHTLQNSPTYTFNNLLPGEYVVYVDEPGIKYFANNFTIVQADNHSENIDLIPLVYVTGKVYNDINENGFDESDLVTNAHVEFYHNDNYTLSSVLLTDSQGKFSGNITIGNYSIYIRYTEHVNDYVHVSTISVTENKPIELNLALEPGFWINGTLTKQKDNPLEHAKITFIFQNESGSLNTISTPASSQGMYRLFLPYREYEIKIEHVSSGNVTYLYYNSSTFLKEDVEKMMETEVETSGSDTISRTTQDSAPSVTKDIHVYEASLLWGYVYWDHNNDKFFYPVNYSTPDEPHLPEIPEPPPFETRSDTRSRQAEEMDNEEIYLEWIKNRLTYYPNDLGGPESELMIGSKLVFEHETKVLQTYTDLNGYYSLFLPPGNTTISIDDSRCQPLDVQPANNLSIFMPFNKSYQIFGIPRNFSVTPVNTPVTGYTWFDESGLDEVNSTNVVTNIPIRFTRLNPVYSGETNLSSNITSDPETGKYSIPLVPGEYVVEVDYDYNSKLRYTQSKIVKVPFNNPKIPVIENISLRKFILANVSIDTDDFELNHSEMVNVSLELLFENGQSLEPLPLELEDRYLVGYIKPIEFTAWAKYTEDTYIEETDETVETDYIYFGSIDFNEKEEHYHLELRKPTYVLINSFVDEDSSDNYTEGEERPLDLNITIIENSGGLHSTQLENGILNQTLMPGTSYRILINDSRQQNATHGFRHVRYISEIEFSIPLDTTELTIDIPLIKYINLSGKVFYDENENNMAERYELHADVPLYFTGPMDFTVISNKTGRFSKYVLPGEYSVTLEHEGFDTKPKIESYTVTLDDSFYDIELIPELIYVHGVTFSDTNLDLVYQTPEAAENEEFKDRLVGRTYVKFARNVIVDPGSSGNLPGTETEPLEESAIIAVSDSKGNYEAYLPPGEYNIYAYPNKYNTEDYQSSDEPIYCTIDLRIFELVPDYSYNVSLYEGKLVEGNVFYRDSNLEIVNDLDSRDTEAGLLFESLESGGSKLVQYFNNGSFGNLYLPYGNYSVSSEYLTEEFTFNLEYSLQETIWVKSGINWYTLEMNRENDFSINFDVIGNNEKELRTADLHRKVFEFNIDNEGNSFNVVDIETQGVPDGWYVDLSNITIPLDISGKYSKAIFSVDITIPRQAYADNDIQVKAIPRGNTGEVKTVTLKVKTPKSFSYELEFPPDLDRGIKFNDSLLFDIDITNKGNADDELYFKFTNYPSTWNVSLLGAYDPDIIDIKYLQNIDSFSQQISQITETKTVTIQVKSPTEINATLGQKATILVHTWSKTRPELEFSQTLDVTLREPDVILKNIKFKNADLKEGTNVNITAVLENKYLSAENISVSLYINDVWVENGTVEFFDEDSIETIDFRWDASPYNLTNYRGSELRFRVVANDNEDIDELTFENNQMSLRKLIGEEPIEEEFNWRPVYFALGTLIVFIIIFAIYRWRTKI